MALGPDGANSKGALTHLLDSTASNFEGQGEKFHQTIEDFSRLTTTLDNNKEELFGTAREIERFVGALSKNDGTVRRFNDSLAVGRRPAQGRAGRPGRRAAQPRASR